MRYGVLTRPKKPSKTTSPGPSDGLATAEAPSKGTSKASSRARTKQSSGQSMPANESTPAYECQPQFLILHPESYVAPSSGSTPGPSANPKPRPRPRRKKAAATADTAEAAHPEQQAGPSTSAAAPSNPPSAGVPASSEDASVVAQKRSRAVTDSPGPQPNKRRRATNSPLEATNSDNLLGEITPTAGTTDSAPQGQTATETGAHGEGTPEMVQPPTLPQEAPVFSAPVSEPPHPEEQSSDTDEDTIKEPTPTSRGRGRGRGRVRGTRSRGRARGRGRGRGRGGAARGESSVGPNEQEGTAEGSDPNSAVDITGHSVIPPKEPQLEGSSSTVPPTPTRSSKTAVTSPAPLPTRRNPARAANKSARP